MMRRTVLCLVVAVLATACGDVVQFDPGDPADFVQQPQTSIVLDADGEVLAELHTEQDRRDVSLDAVADVLESAVIAIEDRRFLLHRGVDAPAVFRALQANIEAGEIEQGGSTITQQYVKNTITGPAVTLERKIQEAVAAFQLEEQYSKAEILERYLNTVYFGKGAYGIRAASLKFFGVEPSVLTLDEASLLAGLIQSPSRYDPFEDPAAAMDRRRVVLDAMVEVGAVTAAEADAAADEPLALAELAEDRYRQPYIVEEVKRIIRDDPNGDLAPILGSDPDDRVTELFTGGLVITTTLDPVRQRQAETAVAERLADEGPAGALVSLEPATGAIRALVGGRDFYDESDPVARFNLATQGRRQPGSSFKPFVLAAALQRGSGLDRQFPGGACISFEQFNPPWEPCNYGGAAYPPMSLREATIRSVNTVYAALGVEMGPAAIVQTARSFGITSDLPQVPSLALGTGEVTPLEMAGAYAPFANLGRYTAPYLIERIERATDGEVLYRADPQSYRVIEEATAYVVTQALSDVVERGTGVRAQIGRPQAGKTGTSQDSADAWFVGYTPDLVTAVWVGFAENRTPMSPPNTSELVEGGRWPAEIWADFMDAALEGVEAAEFPIPDLDIVLVEVDGLRNCLPNPYTPADLIETREYLRGTEPTQRCTEPTGPPIDDVPNVVGLPLEVAERLLTDLGFLLDVRPVVSSRYPPGVVAFQRPGPGESTLSLDRNAVVLWVGQVGSSLVAVPNVVGLAVADAVAVLESDGWVVFVNRGCPDTGCTGEATRVWAMTPPAGQVTAQYSTITITAEPVGAVPTGTTPIPQATTTDAPSSPPGSDAATEQEAETAPDPEPTPAPSNSP